MIPYIFIHSRKNNVNVCKALRDHIGNVSLIFHSVKDTSSDRRGT